MKNKLDNNFFKYACTNCGICTLVLKENFIFDESGLKYSQDISTQNFKKLKKFCPGFGFNYKKKIGPNYSNLIGNYVQSHIGYSNNKVIRNNSASGGIITEILIYLLKKKISRFHTNACTKQKSKQTTSIRICK